MQTEASKNTGCVWRGIIEKYRRFFPITEGTPVISLCEGNTPLIQARNIQKVLGVDLDIWLKFDGANPTGSFKDRGMTMALSKAVEEGSRAVICASTGNTSASAAAYASRAGITCIVVIPEGKIAMGKLAQALVHGALVLQLEGNFDEALRMVKEVVAKYPITLVNSINPFRIEGQKSAAYEICDNLGDAPTYHALPVGNAGNITAYWKGYNEYQQAGLIKNLPKMIGFQAAGAAPIVLGHPVEKPETIATAIRIGNPASWKHAEAARDESGGLIDMVTDEEILFAYKHVAKYEGVFCEPASAASLAGVIKKWKAGYFKPGERVVCTLTGNGLKDPDTAFRIVGEAVKVKAAFPAIQQVIEKVL
ncbi:MAG TPA: threonine synthase [Dissulfurispiraceae bacterium]|nr:threonine synthase [Dissulfurispiraceae bacterium]